MISTSTIESVKAVTDIVEVIGKFVVLKKSGTSYKGLSPFSNEKTPSFFVTPSKGIFKDFSSGKGGDAIEFLKEHEKLTFEEAVRWLCDMYNIPIEEGAHSEELERLKQQKQLFIEINTFANNLFGVQLTEQPAKHLTDRGFDVMTVAKFDIGYALDGWSNFLEKASAYQTEDLVTAGLLKETTSTNGRKKYYDAFRNRIMFPIKDVTGRIIGFGGRTLSTDKKEAKYINSPESIVYDKSKSLYGIFEAKKAIEDANCCYLVEGYTDVMKVSQGGTENVVASSGTSLTQGQCKLIKRYTRNVIIAYDGDSAGRKATYRAIELALSEGLIVKAVMMPEGKDPGSYGEGLKKFLESAKDFLEWVMVESNYQEETDVFKKAETAKTVFAIIDKIKDDAIRSLFRKKAEKLIGIVEAPVEKPVVQIEKSSYVQKFLEFYKENEHKSFWYGEQLFSLYEYVAYVCRVNSIEFTFDQEWETDEDSLIEWEDASREVKAFMISVTQERLESSLRDMKEGVTPYIISRRKHLADCLRRLK